MQLAPARVLASRGLDRSEARAPVDTVLEAVSEI